MAGQPTATLTEGSTVSHILGLKDGSTVRQALSDLATQLLVSPELAALIGSFDLFQGEWDASQGTFPSGASKGQFWRVSKDGAGTVDGVTFGASDVLVALVDDASTEVYEDNWHHAEYAGFSHTHAVSAISGLQELLDGKASADQGEKADTAVQPGDLASVATSGSSDDLSEGVAKLLMTAAERSKLAGIEAGVFPVSDRPGDHPEAFSASYTGAGAGKDPLSGGTEVVGAGTAHVLTGAGTVAARYPVALNNDVVEFTARFRRTANPSDPNNHAVRLQVAWLDKSKSLIGSVQTLATKSDALTSSGLIELSTRVSSMAVEDVVTPPMGTVYACPFIQTYGEDGSTAIETLRSLEVTDLHAVESADLSTLIAQTEAARDAAEAAADAVATETLNTMADVTGYTRASGVGVISLKGGYAAFDGLGGQWVYDPADTTTIANAPYVLVGNDGARYKMASSELVYRTKTDLTTLAASTDIAVGEIVTVLRGYNNEQEEFIAKPPETYTANGREVIDGVAVQAVSLRTWFRDIVEMSQDTRPATFWEVDPATAVNTRLTAQGLPIDLALTGATNVAFENAAGAKFQVADREILEPEAFRATGDGVTVDHDAFQALSARVRDLKSAVIRLKPGAVYIVFDQEVGPVSGQPYYRGRGDVFDFTGCDGVTIYANGALLKTQPGLRYGSFDPATGAAHHAPTGGFTDQQYWAQIGTLIASGGCRNLHLHGVKGDGNAPNLEIGGYWGDMGIQLPHIGIGCSGVGMRSYDCSMNDFGLDGLYVNGTAGQEMDAVFHNFEALRCGRQGCSGVGGWGVTFINPVLGLTGRGALFSSPGAGLDLEDNGQGVGRWTLINPRIWDNMGPGLLTLKDTKVIRVIGGLIHARSGRYAVWPASPGVILDGVQIAGTIVNVHKETLFRNCVYTQEAMYGTDAPALLWDITKGTIEGGEVLVSKTSSYATNIRSEARMRGDIKFRFVAEDPAAKARVAIIACEIDGVVRFEDEYTFTGADNVGVSGEYTYVDLTSASLTHDAKLIFVGDHVAKDSRIGRINQTFRLGNKVIADGDTTPDVSSAASWTFINTAPTAVTSLYSNDTRWVTIKENLGNTTLQDGAKLHLIGGVTRKLKVDEIVTFFRRGDDYDVWYEVYSTAMSPAAHVADADSTDVASVAASVDAIRNALVAAGLMRSA